MKSRWLRKRQPAVKTARVHLVVPPASAAAIVATAFANFAPGDINWQSALVVPQANYMLVADGIRGGDEVVILSILLIGGGDPEEAIAKITENLGITEEVMRHHGGV